MNSGRQMMDSGFQELNQRFEWRFLCYGSKQNRIWFANPENVVFLTLILLHLIPIWAFTYFPSQDGPAHLENANIIREYGRPDRTLLRTYYVLNESLTPNWLGHLLLAGLLSFRPMLAAEKVFLSGY